jgi:hypothetical protein
LRPGDPAHIIDAGEHRFVLIVHAHVPVDWGERDPRPALVTARDGKVTEMVVYSTVEDASPPRGVIRERVYGRCLGRISTLTAASRTAMRCPDGSRVWAKNRHGPR